MRISRRTIARTAAAAATAALVLVAANPAAALACLHTGATQPLQPAGSGLTGTSAGDDVLSGVAATSSTDAWAVGYSGSGGTFRTLIERWAGASWKQVPSPSPGGSDSSMLSAVTATSPSNAWAVGTYNTKGGPPRSLIEHWNGIAWKQVPAPRVAGPGLTAVTATSAANAWAVGSYVKGHASLSLIEHWNGIAWKQLPSPSPGTSGGGDASALSAVAASSASSAWAVGYYLKDRQDGNADDTLIEHWNGVAWRQVPSSNPGGTGRENDLNGVAATSPASAWAVGSYQNSQSPGRTMVLRWTGTAWQQAASPNGRSSIDILYGAAATSRTDAWAVGTYNKQSLIMRWSGTKWQTVRSPNPAGQPFVTLSAVAAASSSSAWAVGYSENGSNVYQTLIERWNGARWLQVPSPSP